MNHVCLDSGEEAIEAINYGGKVGLCTVVSGLKGKIQFESISCREVEHIKNSFCNSYIEYGSTQDEDQSATTLLAAALGTGHCHRCTCCFAAPRPTAVLKLWINFVLVSQSHRSSSHYLKAPLDCHFAGSTAGRNH
jgi:hypothetical protein